MLAVIDGETLEAALADAEHWMAAERLLDAEAAEVRLAPSRMLVDSPPVVVALETKSHDNSPVAK